MQEKPKQVVESSLSPSEVLQDYRLVVTSRQVSLIGRREVMSGKAKFGIFGDGKELAQVAMIAVESYGYLNACLKALGAR